MDPRDRELYEDRSDRMPAGADRPRLVGKLVGAYDPSNRKVYKFFIADIRFDEAENAPLTIDVGTDPIYALDVSGGSDTGSAGTPQYAIIHPLQNDRWGFTRASPPTGKFTIYVVGLGTGFDIGAGDGSRFHVKLTPLDPVNLAHLPTGDTSVEGDCTDVTDDGPVKVPNPLNPNPGGRIVKVPPDPPITTPPTAPTPFVAGAYKPDVDDGYWLIEVTDTKDDYGVESGPEFVFDLSQFVLNTKSKVLPVFYSPAIQGFYEYGATSGDVMIVLIFDVEELPVYVNDRITLIGCQFAPVPDVTITLNSANGAIAGAPIIVSSTKTTDEEGIAYPCYPHFGNNLWGTRTIDWDATGYDPPTGTTPVVGAFTLPNGKRGMEITLCKNKSNISRTTDVPFLFYCVPRKLYLTFWATGVCPDPPYAKCATVDVSQFVGGWVGETVELDLVGSFVNFPYGSAPSYISRCRNNMQFLPPPVGRQSSVIRIGFPPGSTVNYASGGGGIIAKLPVGVDCSTDDLWQGGGFGFGLESVCNPDGTRPTSGKIIYANDYPGGWNCYPFPIFYIGHVTIFDMQIGVWSE